MQVKRLAVILPGLVRLPRLLYFAAVPVASDPLTPQPPSDPPVGPRPSDTARHLLVVVCPAASKTACGQGRLLSDRAVTASTINV